MPDDWELAHGLNPNDPSDAALDSDGDGLTNLEEFRAGTNPQDPANTLAISVIETVGDDLQLGYKTVMGVGYRVDRSDDSPVGPWTAITAGFTVGDGTVQFVTDTGGAIQPARFYRVVAQQTSP